MNPLLVLVIAAQIGTPSDRYCMLIQSDGKCGLWATSKQTYCYVVRSDDKGTVGKCIEPPSKASDIHALPISTRRVEPLVVEPERLVTTTAFPLRTVTITRELLDVPAVPRYVHVKDIIPDVCRVFEIADDKTEMAVCNFETKWYGCDDSRRVLLTAENGTRHCVLFEGAR